MRRLPRAAGTLFSMLALPAAAFGQDLGQGHLDPVRVTAAATARADSLDAKANAIELSRLSDFPKVARLHEQSAGLRSVGDAKRFESLRKAARLRYGAGDCRRAADDMEQAARDAAARGDIVNAVSAYIDVAYIAAELRQGARAVESTSTARLLAGSPLLTEAQRLQLRVRLPHRTDVATLGGR
jgi:hypothetical protein